MIKMRLQGLPDEVSKLVEDLKEKYTVLEVSDEYQNRGDSKFVRVYVTVKSLN